MSALHKRILSFLLLTVFSLYITPKEVFHAFTHHSDTEHAVTNFDGLHFDTEHHHCELLKLDQQFTAVEFALPFYEFEHLQQFLDIQKTGLHSSFKSNEDYKYLFLRGPPATV
jgi:hypothetical protein